MSNEKLRLDVSRLEFNGSFSFSGYGSGLEGFERSNNAATFSCGPPADGTRANRVGSGHRLLRASCVRFRHRGRRRGLDRAVGDRRPPQPVDTRRQPRLCGSGRLQRDACANARVRRPDRSRRRCAGSRSAQQQFGTGDVTAEGWRRLAGPGRRPARQSARWERHVGSRPGLPSSRRSTPGRTAIAPGATTQPGCASPGPVRDLSNRSAPWIVRRVRRR